MNLEAIKKSIKILSINKDSVTIGTEKGCWSKGLEFGNKLDFLPLSTKNKDDEFENFKRKTENRIKDLYGVKE